MPRQFKYDISQTIELIRNKPCLWDKTLDNHKDRVERRQAWEEIFSRLDPNYEKMSREEKRTTGEHIMNKWTNIRDTFVKSLKTKMGRPKRKYILYDHLKFLLKVIPEEDCMMEYDAEPISYMKQETSRQSNYVYSTRKRAHSVDYNEDEEYIPKHSQEEEQEEEQDRHTSAIDFVGVDEVNDPRVMNEDEAFFASLLPTVVKYNEDERLEFRIEVLGVMKKIKEKRNWSD